MARNACIRCGCALHECECKDRQQERTVNQKPQPTQLKPGDLVYRVVSVDLPNTTPHTWAIRTATVKTASDRQITIVGAAKIGLIGMRFKPHSLGLVFFATEREAVLHFTRLLYRQIDGARRSMGEAERALGWARSTFFNLRVEIDSSRGLTEVDNG